MGCDIHIFVEKKVDGKWVSADKWTPYPYADEEGETRKEWVDSDDLIYSDRNYDLFGILANVRNGWGAAGSDTGDGFKPIAMPKGLPSDVSTKVKAESDAWGDDSHSHSWITLEELKAYDWEGQKTKHRGWVDLVNFALFDKGDKPVLISGGVGGQGVRPVSHEDMRKLVEKHRDALAPLFEGPIDVAAVFAISRSFWEKEEYSYHTQIEWEETYAECVRPFFDETIPKLEALSYGRPENIRIVFWFDN
ncbi:MAG: hypothetical protein L0220_31805 [Acidobacteria bacterium]|nr:hypothetical protein [Acidobacteriota bacterium]